MVSRQPSAFPPIDPATLLDLADELARQRSPAAARSAGDRAYYAAFLTSRDQLVRKNYATFAHSGTVHGQVSWALADIQDGMGRMLRELRVARNTLTYDTGPLHRFQDQTLRWMLRTARTLINFVNALPFQP